ncbi:hypothetical protein RB195_001882 [Necator americanus]|uniref:Protein, SNF2 family n=1 Tax=Necator americanus TaxID=51031 RepID=A0ABR1DHV4_NECAM
MGLSQTQATGGSNKGFTTPLRRSAPPKRLERSCERNCIRLNRNWWRMDDSAELDEAVSSKTEPDVDDVEQKRISLARSRHLVLHCRCNDNLPKQLLHLGFINLGKCSEEMEDFVIGDDDLIYIETPLLEDNLIWTYKRELVNGRQKRGYRSRVCQKIKSFMKIKPSVSGETLLQYPADAFSSCGFEMRWSREDDELLLHVYLKNAVVGEVNIVHRAADIRKLVRAGYNRCANTVLGLLYPQFAEMLRNLSDMWVGQPFNEGRENFDAFFKTIREGRENLACCQLNLDGLSTTLLPFQRDAVNFMVDRENFGTVNHYELLRSINLPVHNDIQYFPCLGIFAPHNVGAFTSINEVKGGILADEMGLGKTVELIALILTNTLDAQKVVPDTKEREKSTSLAVFESNFDKGVADTVEFLTSSIVAMTDTEYLAPPKKRFRNTSSYNIKRNTSVQCSICSVRCCMSEMHWSREYESRGQMFVCPQCIEDTSLDFEVSATLIIVPESLLHQWYEEIRRHCKKEVIIDIYYGVAAEGYKHPVFMNTCNIILCTYEALQKEIFYVPLNVSAKDLRKRSHSNFQNYPSPLLAAIFFRICLDESQLVESKVKAASRMCSFLRARYHWCVSGTPLSKSVNDLFGLISSIGLFPYYIDAIWEHYFFNPWTVGKKTAMINLMVQLLWRNTKEDVADQLDKIIREDRLIELSFSPIEERLYSTKIERSKEKMQSMIDSLLQYNNPNTPLSSLPSATVDAIFAIINDVRISILAGESHRRKKYLNCVSDFRMFSPKLIFRKLFEDARTSVIQSHREVIANRNDTYSQLFEGDEPLAGIHWLLGDDLGTLKWYKQAYNVIEEQKELNILLGFVENLQENHYEDNEEVTENQNLDSEESVLIMDEVKPYKPLVVDALQVIHITRNVKELARTLDDAKKFIEMSNLVLLEEKYHKHYVRLESAAVARAKRKWCELDRKWIDIDFEFDVGRMSYVLMLDSLDGSYAFTEFEETVSFLRKPQRPKKPLTYYEVLQSYDEEMFLLRRLLLDFRRALQLMLLPFQPKSEKCNGGVIEDILVPPRSDLEEFTDILACDHNTWFPTEIVAVPELQPFIPLPSVSTSGEEKGGTNSYWFECIDHAVTIDKMLRVGKEMMTCVQEWVNREREIVMGTMRFQLGMKAPVPYLPRSLPFTVDTLDIAVAIYDRAESVAVKTLSSSLSALRYLNTLQRENQSDPNTVRECPCCYTELKEIWIVFPCAHIVCTNCMKKLKSMMPVQANKVRCMSCRQVFPVDGTMYVVDKNDELVPGVRLTVKFEQIIRHLKKLIEEDPTNKVLVFTSISAAIPPFAALLRLLKLPYAVLDKGSKSKTLSKFRSDPELKILVMPLRMGANGLNLTQANHVFFMEPITEISVFAQAVGRIDRIGQRRAITVHNFIVKGSIEEEIYEIVNRGTEQSKWTLNTLRQVFGIEPQTVVETDIFAVEL